MTQRFRISLVRSLARFLKWCTQRPRPWASSHGHAQRALGHARRRRCRRAHALHAPLHRNGRRQRRSLGSSSSGRTSTLAKGTDPNYALHAMGQTSRRRPTEAVLLHAGVAVPGRRPELADLGLHGRQQRDAHRDSDLRREPRLGRRHVRRASPPTRRTRLSTLIPVVANDRMRLSYQSADNAPPARGGAELRRCRQLFSSAASGVSSRRPTTRASTRRRTRRSRRSQSSQKCTRDLAASVPDRSRATSSETTSRTASR